MEQPGFAAVSIWDVSVSGCGFSYYAMKPAPSLNFTMGIIILQ